MRYQLLKSEPVDNDLRDTSYYSNPYRTRSGFYTTWSISDLSTTLYVSRTGSTRTWSGEGRSSAYYVANLHSAYQIDKHARVALSVNNIANKRPPVNAAWESWPFFNRYAYSSGAIGTEYYLTLEYEF